MSTFMGPESKVLVVFTRFEFELSINLVGNNCNVDNKTKTIQMLTNRVK